MNPGSLAEGRYGILEVEKKGSQWQVTKAQLEKLEVYREVTNRNPM